MHKLIIASSTTLQISATLPQVICYVCTFVMWEKLTQVVISSGQFVEQIIYMYST